MTLQDGDALYISTSGGSPAVATWIGIAANANVSIYGPGSSGINNLAIAESPLDTKAHNVNLENIQYFSTFNNSAYIQYMGVMNLTGSNSISITGPYYGLQAGPNNYEINIGSSTSGSLSIYADDNAIWGRTVSITGNAQVTAVGKANSAVSVQNALNITIGASLNAESWDSGYSLGIVGSSLSITNNGSLTASGGGVGSAIYATGGLQITMAPGATTTVTNNSSEDEIHDFTMSASAAYHRPSWQAWRTLTPEIHSDCLDRTVLISHI